MQNFKLCLSSFVICINYIILFRKKIYLFVFTNIYALKKFRILVSIYSLIMTLDIILYKSKIVIKIIVCIELYINIHIISKF